MATRLRHWGRRYPIMAAREYVDQFGHPHTQVIILVKNRLVTKTYVGYQAHLYEPVKTEPLVDHAQ